MRKKLENKKGFTLAELLIVVAIIAVLVAIAVPIYTVELEKSREAVDLANIRSAYAEAVTKYLSDGSGKEVRVTVETIHQTEGGWKIADPKLYTLIDGKEEVVSLPDISRKVSVIVIINANGTVSFSFKPKS